MSNEICILTNIDFTILEFMRGRCRGTDDPLAPILKRKIDSALVMFHTDVPGNVATLNSRVTFSVNGRGHDTRVITSNRTDLPVGMALSVTNARGLALLGLPEGHGFSILNSEGIEERIVLEKVLYQPETSKQSKDAVTGTFEMKRSRPALKLVKGTLSDRTEFAHRGFGGFDDPGPSTA
ncbi:nucleoside-diphosphate kinase [Hoeflea alexandrii]|uniref:nucleoside-diphosphate kinase n=1 Tax=Hoeflea alexandrii TaxID=288436 RepID=UPI0035CF0629